ncbi:spore germination protein [Paenibacillus sp. MZ04-78.2]|uniref:spore germination protein n=1 Tax=Paenibacillus sp. MZ04-78.2 TaxID=2962034 RepID=UPI0020B6D171|nr:spore germination protein [Paenibacillus sp. MZ04-78.2]MCP3772972.1 spore germination protein [Paenibacillus sp. MZ04-78.2]
METAKLTDDLAANSRMIMNVIGHNHDVVLRELAIGSRGIKAAVIYISGLVESQKLNEYVIKPLLLMEISQEVAMTGKLKEEMMTHVVKLEDVGELNDLNGCIESILDGKSVLIADGVTGGIVLNTSGGTRRSINEPVSETLVRGPREGFIESIETNISLLRRSIKDPAFTMLKTTLGRRTKRSVAVAFMDGIVNDHIVETVMLRLGKIDIDDVPESGYIEQFIEDNHYSPFPQSMSTERPDKVVSALLEGRVAILLDGTPFVLVVPVTFPMLLQSPEDYYERWPIGSLVRLLRFVIAFFALFLPSIYIACTSYHPGLIPTRLAMSITASREGVPFPTLVEALIMEVTIEILREAGIRLPKPIGQAVGIVGGLVIGEAAVRAGIVSPIMVIVVAVTAISSFALPQYGISISIRILRFFMMFAAAVFGLYGIMLVFLLVCSHVMKLKSFGVNYAGTFVHYRLNDWKDTFVRFPLQLMRKRPEFLKPGERKRAKP